MNDEAKSNQQRPLRAMAVTAIVSMIMAFAVVALLINILERKQEGANPFHRVVEIDDNTVDPAIWGQNFPLQYDSYLRTVDMERTRHGGSEALPREPTEDDPRVFTSRSRLELEPRLMRMWAGYPFSIDFREARGHAYMLEDQMFTGRHAAPQPGTCLHCHSSTYVAYKEAGDGDIMRGFEILNPLPYEEAKHHVEHPVSCIDCHDPDTMNLRITRPAFIEGIRLAKNDPEYDVNVSATRQELRTMVCAQCHVEYYFQGEDRRLVYPWSHGLKGDEILAYYDEIGFADWIHEETGAPMLKAQHPEYELWSQGVHARAGVSCADCHMPYKRVGAMKISDHHVRSPMLNINNACQTCHAVPEKELLARVENIQDNTHDMLDGALAGLMTFIDDINAAQENGVSQETLDSVLQAHRRATWLIDFVESENSLGFHAPQEAARLLFLAMDYLRKGQRDLHAVLGGEVPEAQAAEEASAYPTEPEVPEESEEATEAQARLY